MASNSDFSPDWSDAPPPEASCEQCGETAARGYDVSGSACLHEPRKGEQPQWARVSQYGKYAKPEPPDPPLRKPRYCHLDPELRKHLKKTNDTMEQIGADPMHGTHGTSVGSNVPLPRKRGRRRRAPEARSETLSKPKERNETCRSQRKNSYASPRLPLSPSPWVQKKMAEKKAASRSRARVQVRKGDGKQPRGSVANVRDEIVATPQDGGAVAQQEPPMPIQQEPPMPMDVEQICVRNASGTPTCAGDFTRPYVYQDDLQPIYPEVPTRSHTPTSSPSSPTTEGA